MHACLLLLFILCSKCLICVPLAAWLWSLYNSATPPMQQIHRTRPDPTSRNCQAPAAINVGRPDPKKRGPIMPWKGKAAIH
ncbi:unnamed protein product [Fusarium graminearum]|nr:unnamed protein product [Fusarium graminearum]